VPSIRPAAVAGSFYPGDAGALAAEVSSYLAEARPGTTGARAPKAIIAPHAGYMYSGPVAASIYSRLVSLRGKIRRVVLAGPAHRVYVAGAAIPASRAFASPLGDVPIDLGAMEALHALPFVEVDDRAHAQEHSLEVHLPFLQSVLGSFELVPIVVGDASPVEMSRLLELLWGGPETLVVVSSDMSHYLPYKSARGRDRKTAEAIANLEANVVSEEACGAAPINGLLRAARDKGLRCEIVDLRNSGDTAGGGHLMAGLDRVVGYGAFAFTEPDA
jgi:AmmeMemoRadiSam system protein B